MAYGMDFMGDSIRIALGEAPESTRRYERGVALFWFEAAPGRVTEIRDCDTARAIPGVNEIVFHTKPGDTLSPIIDCVTRDSVGYVLAHGDTASQAVTIANQARAVCKVITA